MVVVKITDGIGNQMFQYVLGRAISESNGSMDVKYDLSWFDENKMDYALFSLEKVFDIDIKRVSKKELIYVFGLFFDRAYNYKGSKLIKKALRLIKQYSAKGKSPKVIQMEDFPRVFNDEFFHIMGERDIYISGFFQNVEYINRLNSDINGIFKFRGFDNVVMNMAERMKTENSIAIHVRRGDYSNSPFDVCKISYYKKAINYCDLVNSSIYVFSDDEEYVRNSFTFVDYTYCAHGVDECGIDLFLMSSCKTVIIPNSTYSFWGALLGEKKKVIAPKYWKNDEGILYNLNLPEDWIKVDNIEN